MLRISREQLIERWVLTYCQDGFEVLADMPGRQVPQDVQGVLPHFEAFKPQERILGYIIDSPEALEDSDTKTELTALSSARSTDTRLHVIVAAECAHDIKTKFDEWHLHADLIHVT